MVLLSRLTLWAAGVVDGNAIAAHYGFRGQFKRGGRLESTDVLIRYKAYAKEMVCSKLS